MQIQVKRFYFKKHTKLSVKYGDQDYDLTIPYSEDEMTDEFLAKALRVFKYRIAEQIAQDIKFEISTIEPEGSVEPEAKKPEHAKDVTDRPDKGTSQEGTSDAH